MDIFERFRQIIKDIKNPVVFEFGTCEGDDTHKMVSIIKEYGNNFIYHAFEPNKSLYQDFMNRNGEDVGHGLTLYQKAIGDNDCETIFWKSSGAKYEGTKMVTSYHGSSSIKKPMVILREYPEMKFEKSVADVVRLDTHCKEHKLDGKVIDFIWADIQGAEKDLINGGIETFKNVRYFYTEYIGIYSKTSVPTDGYSYEEKTSLQDLRELLPSFEIIEDYGGDILLKNMKL